LSSNEPDSCGCELYSSEKVAGGFVLAGGDALEELEFGEEVISYQIPDQFCELLQVLEE
jgi:hypothetical protein